MANDDATTESGIDTNDRAHTEKKIDFEFKFPIRPMLRLAEIETILLEYRLIGREPVSRDSLIRMCEDQTLEATKTRFGWLVFEDSFEAWVASIQQRRAA